MSPILGIYASSISPSINASSFESIATGTGTGSNNTITFSSIPSTYKHLQIRAIARSTAVHSNSLLWWRFNSDTSTSNYPSHGLYGNGSSVGSYDVVNSYGMGLIGTSAGSDSLSNAYTVVVLDILDYSNTNKNKTVRGYRMEEYNGSGEVRFESGAWLSTNAVNNITIGYLDNATSYFTSLSQIALYGIRG